METSKRLQEAFRRFYTRKTQPQIVQRVAQALERPVEHIVVLDLEATDHLWELILECYQRCEQGEHPYLHRTWRGSELEELQQVLAHLRRTVPAMPMYLFVHKYCGAVQTTSEELVEKALPLVARFDVWSAVSEDGAHWMLLDMTVDDDPGEDALGTTPYDEYALEVAGELFVEALQRALNQISSQSKPDDCERP
jgi:hypothetical protein